MLRSFLNALFIGTVLSTSLNEEKKRVDMQAPPDATCYDGTLFPHVSITFDQTLLKALDYLGVETWPFPLTTHVDHEIPEQQECWVMGLAKPDILEGHYHVTCEEKGIRNGVSSCDLYKKNVHPYQSRCVFFKEEWSDECYAQTPHYHPQP